jgi:hypothetical protein
MRCVYESDLVADIDFDGMHCKVNLASNVDCIETRRSMGFETSKLLYTI